MRTKYACLIAVLFLGGCSRIEHASNIAFPCEWPGSPGFTPAANFDRQNIPDPPGICLHPSRKTFFVVSDEGFVYEIKQDGTPLDRIQVPGDLEDITVDPSTGLLYIIVEGDDVILEYDPDGKEVTRRFPVNREYRGNPHFLQKQTDRYDNGMESLAFVPNPGHPEGGTFYAGNQEDPACLMEVFVPLRSSKAKEAEARILRVLPFQMRDPGALFYDSRKKLLNVVSDSDNLFVELTLDGQLVREYAFPGNNQEGIAWDEQGYLYICQDSEGIIKLKDLRGR
jgi:hypothetical protein